MAARLILSYSPQPRVGWVNISTTSYNSIDEAVTAWKAAYFRRATSGLGLAIVEVMSAHKSWREGDNETHIVPDNVICEYKHYAPQSTNGPLPSGRH